LGPTPPGGWIYQYVLYPATTARPSAGIYHDAAAEPLVRQPGRRAGSGAGASSRRSEVREAGACPLTGKALVLPTRTCEPAQSPGLVPPLPAHRVHGVAESHPSAASSSSTGGAQPERLLAYNLPVKDIMMAVQRSNNDVGGSVIE